jgi:pimeloyl-ACP methyl ester carboxylesterase
MVEK